MHPVIPPDPGECRVRHLCLPGHRIFKLLRGHHRIRTGKQPRVFGVALDLLDPAVLILQHMHDLTAGDVRRVRVQDRHAGRVTAGVGVIVDRSGPVPGYVRRPTRQALDKIR